MQFKNTELEKTFELVYYFNNSRETKEMMASQTKLSVDTSKEVQADPSLKSKVSIIFFTNCQKILCSGSTLNFRFKKKLS